MSDRIEQAWPPEDAASLRAFVLEQLPASCFKNGDKSQELCPTLESMLTMKVYAYDSIYDAVVRKNVATMTKSTFVGIDISWPLGVMRANSPDGERLICRLGHMGLESQTPVQTEEDLGEEQADLSS